MREMASINCGLGKWKDTSEVLQTMNFANEPTKTRGTHCIAKVNSDAAKLLRKIITWNIYKLSPIRVTLSIMAIYGQHRGEYVKSVYSDKL